MCTVTIVPLDRRLGSGAAPGFRLACNRDESPARPPAEPPRLLLVGSRVVAMPIDPVSGGTWIAVNDAGLAMVLLNLTASTGPESCDRSAAATSSRGVIIPALMHAASPGEVMRSAITAIDPWRHRRFRLVMTDGEEIVDLVFDGSGLRPSTALLGARPRIFTSSGLGDDLVEAPRRRLFEAFFLASGDLRKIQDAYHRHSWPDRPHLSVCMRRPDAMSVSRTVIEVAGSFIGLSYFPGAPDTEPAPVTVRPGDRPRRTVAAWAS